MIYKIKEKFLEVSNEIKELDEYIYGRFSQFEKISKKETTNYLKFGKDSVEILLDGNSKILNNRIIKTDIYPIVNNVIAYLINDSNNIFIHGIVVSKNEKGILIVGDFGQGKSTLAREFEKNGFETNSTDQTWLEKRNDRIYMNLGSSFDIENGRVKILQKEQVLKNVEIKQIIRITGICDNGKVSLDEITNKFYVIKNLSYFCNWSYSIPIFTDDVVLYNTTLYTKKFLNKIIDAKIQVFDARGDKKKIVKELGELK